MGLSAAEPKRTAANSKAAVLARLDGKKIVIYGAGSAGCLLLKLLNEAGMTVACFVDKSASRIRSVGKVPVYAPEYIADLAREKGYVLIVAINSKHAWANLSAHLTTQYPALLRPLCGQDVISALAPPHCQNKLWLGQRLDLRDCMCCRADPCGCRVFRKAARNIAVSNAKLDTDVPKLRDFALFVTNRCTLRCVHCVEKLPYYKHREAESAARALSSVRKLVGACGPVYRLSITGGEPLLNTNLPQILDGLLTMPGIGYIYLYTTGTVIPRAPLLAKLRDSRIAVNVSDYGDHLPIRLREKQATFLRTLNDYQVAYRAFGNKLWFDLGQFEPLNLGVGTLRESFANCAFANCITICDGVLYRCPHQLAGIRLGCCPSELGQTVNVNHLEGHSLAQAVTRFLALEFINACGCCRLSIGAQEVPAAIQCREGGLDQLGKRNGHAS
ncbi:MAG: radical SAM protein [Polyangia bacterium]